MKTQLDPAAVYWASFNRFELRLPAQAVFDIAQSGANDAAVAVWTPRIFQTLGYVYRATADKIREELREYGAWNDVELTDDAQNQRRLIWIAAHNIAEDDAPDCSDPVSQ